MNPLSPTGVSFRLLFRRPLIPIAEIAWRWTFAAAAWALGTAFLLEYLDSLPVRTLDRLLLSTGQPFLIAQALRRIFSGSSLRFIEAGILVALGLTVAWVLIASLGRLAILRSIFDELETRTESPHAFRSLVFLNFIRAAVVLAAKLGAIGSIFILSSFWASTHVRMADVIRLEFLVWAAIWLAWAVLNWLLSTAALFVVAEGKNSLSAIGAVVRLLQSRTAGMLGASAVFGVIHFAAFVMAFGTVLVLLPIAAARPVILPLIVLVILGYCFIADFLYTGRLAAYAFLAEGTEELPSWMASRPTPPPGLPSASVDKDELILGDLPAPA